MLISSDLARLKTLLKSPLDIEGATLSSVVSPVITVSGLTMELFQYTMLQIFRGESSGADIDVCHVDEPSSITDEVLADMKQLSSWDWTFGKGPSFKIRFGASLYSIEHGLVQESPFSGQKFNPRLFQAIQDSIAQ
jgi:hypothetical protein